MYLSIYIYLLFCSQWEPKAVLSLFPFLCITRVPPRWYSLDPFLACIRGEARNSVGSEGA